MISLREITLQRGTEPLLAEQADLAGRREQVELRWMEARQALDDAAAEQA